MSNKPTIYPSCSVSGFDTMQSDVLTDKIQQKITIRQFMKAEDIYAILEEFPNLTDYGFGTRHRAPTPITKRFSPPENSSCSISYWVEECNKACMFLRHLEKQRTINMQSSTYGLKHDAEYFLMKLGVANCYLSNGAFISAARFMGFNVAESQPNGFINYSKKSPIIRWRSLAELRSRSLKQVHDLKNLEASLGLHQPIFEYDPVQP